MAGRLLATRVSGRADLALVLTRVCAAGVFIAFGVGKFSAHASEVDSFDKYGLPSPDAFVYAIGVLEIGGGALLLAGLATRVVALVMAGDMAAAIALSGAGQGEIVSLTLAPAMLAIMVALMWAGPGTHSLDERLRRARERPGAT